MPKCDFCGKWFRSNKGLKIHKHIHNEIRIEGNIFRESIHSDEKLLDWLDQEQKDIKKIEKTRLKKPKSIIKITAISIIALIVLFSITAFGYYMMDSNLLDIKQDVQILEDELKDTFSNIDTSKDELSNLESQLILYQDYLDENNTELLYYTTGNEYKLHNPIFSEVEEFINEDKSENISLMIENAKEQGIRCAFVYVSIPEGRYELVGFDTIDEGMVYFEPVFDYRVLLEIGKSYVDCFPDEPYYATDNDIIEDILIFW